MHRSTSAFSLPILAIMVVLATACQPAAPEIQGVPTGPRAVSPPPTTSSPPSPPALPTNPLTGLRVAEPSLLQVPAVLVSISHFPATARPQAGLSFAPFVYEFSITEGATRFLAVFYGEWPRPELPVEGGCPPRVGPLSRNHLLLGNRVWNDSNADGLQDVAESGISGLCLHLYDGVNQRISSTTTDSNGYYGFDVPAGTYSVEFARPAQLGFTRSLAGDHTLDSDVDPATARAEVVLTKDQLSIDAGLVVLDRGQDESGDAPKLPLAQVGPIRSGRLIYRHLARSFQDSCLVFAYASPEVLARLPQCKVVFHQILGGGYMLDLEELWDVARANQRRTGTELDYSAYEFSSVPPADGRPARALDIYFAYQNQSGWYYDEPSQSYFRYVDTSERSEAGVLYPDTDRLTGRQLKVENVVVLFAKHEVISPTNLDILLDAGRTGKAILFRDGLTLNIDWSTVAGDDEPADRPIRLLQKNGEPALLHPGHTWVIVVTPESELEQTAEDHWQLTFSPPPGAK